MYSLNQIGDKQMAYLSKDDMKLMRAGIKKQFPSKAGWKLSITRSNSSSINVVFKEAPVNLISKGRGYYQVNPYYIEEHFEDQPEALKAFMDVKKAILDVRMQVDRNAGDPGADYGDTNFFYNISVGEWNKPFLKV